MISRSTSTVNQDGHTLSSVQGNIEFRNVYFSYLSRPEIPILSGFYLTVPARKTVALVGRNGSGKSSIIPLMERFYDPTLGIVVAIYYLIFILPWSWFIITCGAMLICCRWSAFGWGEYQEFEARVVKKPNRTCDSGTSFVELEH